MTFVFCFLVLLCSCKNEVSHESKTDKIVQQDTTIIGSSYVEPEIHSMGDLKELLNQADQIIGYNFNGRNGNPSNGDQELYEDGKLRINAENRTILSRGQRRNLLEITTDTSTYNGNWSGIAGTCFIPHMGFGLFKEDSLIAQINVCFLCDGIRTRPYYCSDGLTHKGKLKLRKIAAEIGLNIIDGGSKLSH